MMMEAPLLVSEAGHPYPYTGMSSTWAATEKNLLPSFSPLHDSFFSCEEKDGSEWQEEKDEEWQEEVVNEQEQQQLTPLSEQPQQQVLSHGNSNVLSDVANCKRPRRDSSCCEATAKNHSRRVSWSSDENDCPVATVHCYEKTDSQCLPDMFWDRTELQQFMRAYKEAGAVAAATRHDCVESIRVLFSQQERVEAAIRCCTETRGLERRLLCQIKQHRKFSIRLILQLQAELQHESVQYRQAVLSEKCKELTARAVHLAACLAEADAVSAQQ